MSNARRLRAQLILLAPILIASSTPSWIPTVPPTAADLESAYWAYMIPATLLLDQPPAGMQAWCKGTVRNHAYGYPGPAARGAELRAAALSPVLSARLDAILFGDDCAVLLWYFRTATTTPFNPGGAPALARLPEARFHVAAAAENATEAETQARADAERAALAMLDSADVRRAAVEMLRAAYLPAEYMRAHPRSAGAPPRSARPSVELAVMSACPYGIQAELALGPALAHFGESVDARLRFISYDAPADAVPPELCARAAAPAAFNASAGDVFAVAAFEPAASPNLCSMHGSDEADEDVRQLALAELYGEKALWAYLAAFNGQGCAREAYAACSARAAEAARVDSARIVEYAASHFGALVEDARGWVRAHGGHGSPTLFVNGVAVGTGARTTLVYAQLICRFFDDGTAPDVCSARSLAALEASQPPAPRENAAARAGGARGRAAEPSCLQPELGALALPQPRAVAGAPAPAAAPADPSLLVGAMAVAALALTVVATTRSWQARMRTSRGGRGASASRAEGGLAGGSAML
jgi:hypothetical protein